jgi:putative transcriptional regulator
MKSLQGHFLVASPHLHDSTFSKAVVLVVDHTENGAFGLIVSGPGEDRSYIQHDRFREQLPQLAKLYNGGPVTGPLMAVHTKPALSEWRILPGLFFSGDEKNVLSLMRSGTQPCKLFFGYAGWDKGQLEYEVEKGVWRAAPATCEQLFADDGDLWEMLTKRNFDQQLSILFNIRHVPADPLLN